jgi:A/G-specific adenine glycosylase
MTPGKGTLAGTSRTLPEGRRLRAISRRLLAWFSRSARRMDWRETGDPYRIWVSEIMLQQTRVEAVTPYDRRFVSAFPTLRALAESSPDEVLKLWEGLGYYSRARNLHRAAKIVALTHGGRVPADPEAFRALPGVGPYTCAAVMSIAFDRDMAVVDGNVKRVLARLFALAAPSPRDFDALAAALLPRGTAALHNQAMMELGARICTPRSPSCPDCPLGRVCRAWAAGEPEAYPPRRTRPAVPHRRFAVGLVLKRGEVLVDRRPPGGLLGGLWEFPRVELDGEGDAQARLAAGLRQALGEAVRATERLPDVTHAYSHFRVTLEPWLCERTRGATRAREGQPTRWIAVDRLEELPMSTADRKLMRGLRRALRGSG